jgi:hypothetical protein
MHSRILWGVFEFMVGVDDQDGVNGLSRQLRIIGIRMDYVYVVLVSQQRSDSQDINGSR